MAIILCILVAIILLVAIYGKTPMTITSHPWNHFYDNIQFSSTDFYVEVERGLRGRKVEGLNYAKESFLQSHIFSARREYLRITQGEYIFYICAAPFGTGMFVSWWLCVKDEKIRNRIPILSKLAGIDRGKKSFYQMDTEAMYRGMVHNAVIGVADALTGESGYRLTELDRQYKEIAK